MKSSAHGIFWVKSQEIYILYINGAVIAKSNSRHILRERAEMLGFSFQ